MTSFGALMPDKAGNLFMVFETMSSTLNPSVWYVARRTTDPPGQFPDKGLALKEGGALSYSNCPKHNKNDTACSWGDYEATSYDGPSTNIVWFAGEYANNGVWSTYIGKAKF